MLNEFDCIRGEISEVIGTSDATLRGNVLPVIEHLLRHGPHHQE